MKVLFCKTCILEDDIVDILEFSCLTNIGNKGNVIDVRVKYGGGNIASLKIRRFDNSKLPSEVLLLDDIRMTYGKN